jgi:hypothetical protein
MQQINIFKNNFNHSFTQEKIKDKLKCTKWSGSDINTSENRN